MKKKAFTLVELLVVIAIIAMLLAILMPALNKVRQIAYRMVCGSNLSGLGKACMVYANDYQESYPFLGGATTFYSNSVGLAGGSMTWGVDVTTLTGASQGPAYLTTATNTSCMYLLVKYSDVSTKQFVCKATDSKAFDLTLVDAPAGGAAIKDVTQVFDFGPLKSTKGGFTPWSFCSYAYNLQYKATSGDTTSFTLTASTQAGTVLFADKNPWFDPATGAYLTTDDPVNGPHLLTSAELGNIDSGTVGTVDKTKTRAANSKNHQSEGQEVLYADGHVAWETQPNVGIEQDNIYTPWTAAALTASQKPSDKQCGVKPSASNTTGRPQDASDSFLAN